MYYYTNKKAGVLNKLLAVILLFSIVFTSGIISVSAFSLGTGERSDTIPGNLLYNPEFGNSDFALSESDSNWYPNNCILSKDTGNSYAGGSSLKVSGRNDFWHRAEYRIGGWDVALSKDYYLRGYVSAAAATNVDFYLDIVGYNGEGGYPEQYIVIGSGTVGPDAWTKFDCVLNITSTPNAEAGFIDLTVSYGSSSVVVSRVKGLGVIKMFVQEQFHTAGPSPDLYLDSFLFRQGGNPHANGTNTETLDGNLVNNSSFESNTFDSSINVGKWYPNNATLTQVNNYSQSGGNSLKVSGRTDFWHRPEYRIDGSAIVLDKDYIVSGYLSASANTTVNLYIGVTGDDGAGGYPSQDVLIGSASIGPAGWTKIDNILRIKQSNNIETGFYDYTISYGSSTSVITHAKSLAVLQLFVQEAYHAPGVSSDLFLDSFVFRLGTPKGHDGGINTETTTGNLINNASFETNDFNAGMQNGKWYKRDGMTGILANDTAYSQSGTSSLKISNRTAFWHRAEYRVNGALINSGKEYTLSGYVSASESLSTQMIIDIWAYGGSPDPYPHQAITLATSTAGPAGWTKLSGTFKITAIPNTSDPSYVDLTIAYGSNTAVISHVSGLSVVEITVQEPYNEDTVRPDLYMDSFSLVQNPNPQPIGLGAADNTEDDAGNLIHNASFETADFASDHNFSKWYKTVDSTAVLTQLTDYSHGGLASLKVSNRTAHWNRAQYRVEGSNILLGREYVLSGFVSAREEINVELALEIWAYGGSPDPYPMVSMILATSTAGPADWTTLGGTFTVASTPNAVNNSKVDLTVTYGSNSFVIENVSGLSAIQIAVQEPYNSSIVRPDMYLDSFLLKAASLPPPTDPTGHAGAMNTETDPDNLIGNASFETNELGTGMNFGKWYPDGNDATSIALDSTYSHSGNSSLKISNRNEFWHRADFRVEGGQIAIDREYLVSGYASALETADVELIIEIFGYGGSAENPYPSKSIVLSAGTAKPGEWTRLSGTFKINQSPNNDTGYYNYTISYSAGGEKYIISHIKGISGIQVMTQEKYSLATPRTNLYLDSFLFKMNEKIGPAVRPTGHTNAANTAEDFDNLIENASFETDQFASDLQMGLWYPVPNTNTVLTQLSDYSHSGSHSLQVSGRTEFWHRAMFRVDCNDFVIGHEYELSGYASSLRDTGAEMWIVLWGHDNSGGYPSAQIRLTSASISPSAWKKLSAKFKVKRQGADYILESGDQTVKLSGAAGLDTIEVFIQTQYGVQNNLTDMYLDSFLLKDLTGTNSNIPSPTGSVNAPDTEALDDNLINNAGFETDLFYNALNFGIWFTNGKKYKIEQTATYSHSGSHSVRIFNRKSANNTLIYRVDATMIKYGTSYDLSAYIAARQETKAKLLLTVYGYDGEGHYPNKTSELSKKSVKDFTQLSGEFTVRYDKDTLYLNSADGTIEIGKCKGLSGIEFYVITDDNDANYTTDLYFDSFALLAGSKDSSGNPSISASGEEDPTASRSDIAEGINKNTSVTPSGNATQKTSVPYLFIIIACAVIIAGSTILIAWLFFHRKKYFQSKERNG